MKLYHGTAGENIPKMLRKGVVPRGKRAGNWKHTVESNPDAVYLTTCYAGYFAHCAARTTLLGVLEIDTDHLDSVRLCPDEDFLAHASFSSSNEEAFPNLKPLDSRERTAWFRKRIGDFALFWPDSLEALGTCCYLGSIPAEAITRAVTFDYRKNLTLGREYLEPVIAPLNYRFCGDRYKALTRWLFNDPVDVKEFSLPRPEPIPASLAKMYAQADKHWRRAIKNREGIEVIKQ